MRHFPEGVENIFSLQRTTGERRRKVEGKAEGGRMIDAQEDSRDARRL
jgi:hypothetical protein